MNEPLKVVSPKNPFDRVVERMSAHGIRCAPMVHKDERVGIVAIENVVALIGDELHEFAGGSRRALDVMLDCFRTRKH